MMVTAVMNIYCCSL